MKIKKSTRKKVKKVAKKVKRTVNRYATKIGLRRKNPSFMEGVYYSILTKEGEVWKGLVEEAEAEDGTGTKFVVLVDRRGRDINVRHDNIRDYKPINEWDYISTYYDRPQKY